MMPESAPLVSICMPVYNEGEFLEETLKSLFSQSYKNIEVLVSDNCSEDDSYRIAQDFARNESRLVVHRNSNNVGITKNFQILQSLARGDYFIWLSGHDVWTPNYIETLVKYLENNSDAVLAFGSAIWMDRSGKNFFQGSGLYDSTGLGACTRFVYTILGSMNPILGLISVKKLRKVPKLYGCVGSDLIFLSTISLVGGFAHVADAYWYRREFRKEENYAQQLKRYRSPQFGLIDNRFAWRFPFVYLVIKLFQIVCRSGQSILKKILLILLLPWLLLVKLVDFKESAKLKMKMHED